MGVRIYSYRWVKCYNKEVVKKVLVYYGLVIIFINVNLKILKFYSYGVLDDILCSEYRFFFCVNL